MLISICATGFVFIYITFLFLHISVKFPYVPCVPSDTSSRSKTLLMQLNFSVSVS